jgi:periplasmic divalent cation tolerance protein
MNNPNSKKFVLLYSLTGTEMSAVEIANSIIEKDLAACVNIFPGIRSFYKWNGKIQNETEFALLIKTTEHLKADCLVHLRSLHPYEIPAFIEIETSEVNDDFIKWMLENIQR